MNLDDESVFDQMPRFDARDFEPPSWAKGPHFQWADKNAESSGSTPRPATENNVQPRKDNEAEDEESDDEEEEEWADASEGGPETDPDLATFTVLEYKVCHLDPVFLASHADRRQTNRDYWQKRQASRRPVTCTSPLVRRIWT